MKPYPTLTTPKRAHTVYKRLRDAEKIVIEITRGQPLTLHYTIR